MRTFNYSLYAEQKWDTEILGYVAAIYKAVGKQEMYLKQRPEELEKLVEIIKQNGKWDQMIVYPTFVHVSWKRFGPNRKQTLRKA